MRQGLVIYPDFSLNLTNFLANKMQDSRKFVLYSWILMFDAEQEYFKLKPQASHFKNKEVTENPNPQTRGKYWFFKNPEPTLNPTP